MVEEKGIEYIGLWSRFKIWLCDRIGAMSYYDYQLMEEEINTQLELIQTFMSAQGKFDQWVCHKIGSELSEVEEFWKDKDSVSPLGDAGKESVERGVYQ